jgi:hypothetical protein
MKKQVLTIMLCLSAAMTFNTHSNAQGTLIHYWNFNSFTGPVATPAVATLAADFSLITSPAAAWVYQPLPATTPSTSCDAYPTVSGDNDTINLRMIAPSGNAFRARNPNDQMEILIYMPTTGYVNLKLTYACMLSSYTSGDSVNVFSYSLDSGSSWVTSGGGLSHWVDSGSSPTFRRISVNINDAGANNNPKFVFRIQLVGRNNGTSGNNRFDNVSLDGDAGTPSLGNNNFTKTEASYYSYPNPANNLVNINSNVDGAKSVVITNMLGQTVYNSENEGTLFSINTNELTPGIYYVTIREINSGSITKLKFVKQ